jgi:uncharacterized protein
MVLDELLAALSKVPVRAFAVTGVDAIRSNPNVEVIPQTSLRFAAAYDLYRSMTDKEWSLTDCASFVLMRERAMSEALAYDHHWVQSAAAGMTGRKTAEVGTHPAVR